MEHGGELWYRPLGGLRRLPPACAGQYKVSHMLAALQEMALVDDSLAHVLWVLLLPIVWATLGEKKDQQVNLARPVIALIGKGYHERQASMRPNVVQARSLGFQQRSRGSLPPKPQNLINSFGDL